MLAMNTQRSITYRGMAILLGCAIAFLGGTTVSGMGALAETNVATDSRQRIAVTIDEIRAFQRQMFANAPGVDEPARLNLTAEEMYFLEANLFLPGDTGAASTDRRSTRSYDQSGMGEGLLSDSHDSRSALRAHFEEGMGEGWVGYGRPRYDVDEPVKLNVTADEMLFLEQNLFLPGDTDGTLRSDDWTSGLTNR